MSSKRKESEISKQKNKVRKSLNLEEKLAILNRYESGQRCSDICKALNLSSSTVSTVKANELKIRAAAQAGAPSIAKNVLKVRSSSMEIMEKRLSAWISHATKNGLCLSTMLIQEKARKLYDDILSEREGIEEAGKPFTASRGWFQKFKIRNQMHNIKLTGEAASADHEAAAAYPDEFAKIISDGEYLPQQIYNADETGLYWKRMPSRTFIAKDEKRASGSKPAKQRLSLLLGGNASGDHKLRPLLVYQYENPRCMKNINKNQLPVVWASNASAWMKKDIFLDWFQNHFVPSVREYSEANNIGNKALLILDNFSGHGKLNDLQADNIKVVFLPANTTSLIQPMDQGIIAAFKKYYLRLTFRQLVQSSELHNKSTIKNFWDNFTILKAIKNIDLAWKEVSDGCMNKTWKNICPACVKETADFEGFDLSSINNEIVGLAQEAGFGDEIQVEDIEELLQTEVEQLSNERLVEMDNAGELDNAIVSQQQELINIPEFSLKNLTDIFQHFEQFKSKLEEYDPDKARSSKSIRAMESTMLCYREILREKKKKALQPKIDSFFKKPDIRPPPVATRPIASASGVSTTEIISQISSDEDDDYSPNITM